MIKLLKLSVT